MSSVRIKIFSFNSSKFTTTMIEEEVNKFLARPEVNIVDTADIDIIPDDTTIIKVVYTIQKLSKSKHK